MHLISSTIRLSSSPAEELGTTLIELLVAMLTAIVVLFALLAILQFSTNQNARISDRVQANRLGRVAMAKITDELHSACTGFEATAIQAPGETPAAPLASTGATDLWFVSDYGNTNSGSATDSEVIEHDIHWAANKAPQELKTPTGQTLGTLTDYRFPSTGGTPAKWEFPPLTLANETADAHVLSTNVVAPTLPATPTLFHYFKFESETTSKLAELTSAQAATAAGKGEIAKVSINFTQAPEAKDTTPTSAVSLSDSVLLRFSPPETGTEAENTPCA
jgi:type II secretory pathway component PulJ